MIISTIVALLTFNTITYRVDTLSYVCYDSFVQDTCRVCFLFEPKQLFNELDEYESICLTQFKIDSIQRDTTYSNHENRNYHYEKVFGYYSLYLSKKGSEEAISINDMNDYDVFDNYVYYSYKDDAMLYYSLNEDISPCLIIFTLVPKKVASEMIESLTALSDSLCDPVFVRTKHLDHISSPFGAESRNKMIASMDYRFEYADSIFIMEVIDERIMYWAYIYSPDISVYQPWLIHKHSGKMVTRHLFEDHSCHKMQEVIYSEKKNRSDKEYGYLTNFFNFLLFTKNSQGQFEVARYEKTQKTVLNFLPKRPIIGL